MKSHLTLGSLFDGIGGFPLVAMSKNITPVWASEIEKFPMEVTKLHFPEMLHLGDITQINGATIPVVDIISGGSPCQDLSVAGKRAGLEGARSGLFMEQIRIIREMREEDAKRGRTDEFIRPRYGIWENVPGAFSSAEGEDFKAVLEEFVKLHDSTVSIPRPDNGAWKSAGAILLGRGFSLAWRTLDAQFWGVPQRRRRIYLVCDFGGTTAPQILFKQDSLFGNTAEGRSSWQGTARPAESGVGDTGRSPKPIEPLLCLGDQGGERMDIEVEKTPTLRAGTSGHPPLVRQPKSSAGFVGNASIYAGTIGFQEECAPTLRAGATTTVMTSHEPMVMATQQGGAEIGEGICPTITASAGMSGNNGPVLFDNHARDCRYNGPLKVCPTIASVYGSGGNNIPLLSQPMAFSLDSKESNSMKSDNPHSGCREVDTARTIDTTNPDPSKNQGGIAILQPESYCIAGNIIDRQVQNGGNGLGCQADIAYTITATDRHAVMPYQKVVGTLMHRDHKGVNTTYVDQDKCIVAPYQDTIGALCAGDTKGIGNQYVGQDKCIINPTVFGESSFGNYEDGVSTIRASGGNNGGGSENLAVSRNLVRRLTPLECERLQGFPDNWTNIPKAADSPRYKALGNSVAIPCVEFVLNGVAYFLRKQYEME